MASAPGEVPVDVLDGRPLRLSGRRSREVNEVAVRNASPADLPRVADAMGSAFFDNPIPMSGHRDRSALLRAVLDRCRPGRRWRYLGVDERSKLLYEKYGFEATAELTLPKGPSFFPMWRAASKSP